MASGDSGDSPSKVATAAMGRGRGSITVARRGPPPPLPTSPIDQSITRRGWGGKGCGAGCVFTPHPATRNPPRHRRRNPLD